MPVLLVVAMVLKLIFKLLSTLQTAIGKKKVYKILNQTIKGRQWSLMTSTAGTFLDDWRMLKSALGHRIIELEGFAFTSYMWRGESDNS